MSEQKLKQKSKKKAKKKAKQKLSQKQKLAVAAIQKHLQLLNFKEALLLVGFTVGAALLRVPMQAIPSAEPLTFFAILSGWLFGRYKGAAAGATSLYISNFFMFGGQGPWTPFQAMGFALAGFLGGFLRKKASYLEIFTITAIATLGFEIIMNSVTPLMTGTSIFIVFAFALPFTLIHLISNLVFALALPKAKKFVEKTGGFDEKAIFVNLLAKYDISSKLGWFKRFKNRKELRQSHTDN